MKKQKPQVRIVSATEAKNRFGEMLKHAYAAEEHLIVEKSGIPVVAIIPMTDYQHLVNETTAPAVAQKTRHASRHAAARSRLKDVLTRAHAQLPRVKEAEAEREIARAVKEVRGKR